MTQFIVGYGDKGRSTLERFESFFIPEPNSGCWLWLGHLNACGYGVFGMRGRSVLAHRVSYFLFVSDFSVQHRVLHHCDLPCCVNPQHLFLGTQGDNVRDMENKGRSYHPRGEAHGRAKLTEDDVRAIRLDRRGQRVIGKEYGVSAQTILAIRRRKIWGFVK